MSNLTGLGRDLARGLLQLLYPGVCAACNQALPESDRDFCTICRTALATDPHLACPRCAATIGPFVSLEGGCISCREYAFQFDSVLRLGPYDGLLRDVRREPARVL